MGAYAADSSKYDWCRHYPAPRQSGPGGRNFHLFLDYNKLLCYLSGLCICQVWYVQQDTGWYGGYAEYIFGTAGNFLCCYTYTVSILVSNVAIALSAVGYGATCLDISLGAVPTCLYTIGVIWLTTVPNFRGAGITGRIGGITILGVLIPVFIIATAGWFFFSPSIFVMNWNVQNLPFSQGILQSVVMTLWAFLGLESACVNADAVENPERNVPIAVLGGHWAAR